MEPCYKCHKPTDLTILVQAKMAENYITHERIPACAEHKGQPRLFNEPLPPRCSGGPILDQDKPSERPSFADKGKQWNQVR